jgi:hypothetical protein
LGIGINRSNYAQGIFGAYQSRVIADGGVTEAGACVDAVSSLLQSASLLIIPSGYKGGKAYAEIPTNGNGDLTWTRASDAWRTNADGLIQRVPWNLVLQSEDFSSGWIPDNLTVTTNSTTAPNGTTTADSLTTTTTTQCNLIQNLSFNVGVYTMSIYIKKVDSPFIYVEMGSAYVWFNLTTGANSGGTQYSSDWSYISATSENVGNGWFRFQMVAQCLTAGTYGFRPFQPVSSSGSYNPSATNQVTYVWGAQLNIGSTAKPYFPTTDRLNVPRLSYMYGSCPALLLEPQRTNLLTYSTTFSSLGWAMFTGPAVTPNSTTSPDGTTNATTLNSAGGTNDFLFQTLVGLTIGSTYTNTVYIKNNNSTASKIWGASGTLDINWSGSTLTSVSGTGGFFTSVGNGWYRVGLTLVATSATPTFRIYSDINNTSKSVYIYQAQWELGAYPTTAIPTTTASATRVADSFSRNNIFTNGLITSSGGTWFVELRNNITYLRDTSGNTLFVGDNSTGSNNALTIRNDSPSTAIRFNIVKYIGGVQTGLFSPTTSTVKIAIKWNGSTADVFVNGTKQISATAFTPTNMEFLGCLSQVPTFVQAMALYPSPLSDTDCTTLTTL